MTPFAAPEPDDPQYTIDKLRSALDMICRSRDLWKARAEQAGWTPGGVAACDGVRACECRGSETPHDAGLRGCIYGPGGTLDGKDPLAHKHVWQAGTCVAPGHDRDPEFGTPESADKFRSAHNTHYVATDEQARAAGLAVGGSMPGDRSGLNAALNDAHNPGGCLLGGE